mgnify:CR=1 FL=1
MAPHTVFKIGGPAKFFVEAHNRDDFIAALRAAGSLGLPWMVLGAGSNVLVSDRGFPGFVVHPVGGTIRINGHLIQADGALSMARVAAESLKAGLSGFEWAVGVPGTIGGSARGNAGCFGSEMKDAIRAISVFNTVSGEVEEWAPEAAEFGYRDSIFKRRPEFAILSATLELRPLASRREGEELVRDYTLRRSKNQDIGSQSAGCVFKNIPWDRRDINREKLLERFPGIPPSGTVPGISAGFLIDQAGLRGYQIGGVKISERHGNFFINAGQATAEEVVMLIGLAKERVHRFCGLLLEEEIQYVGFYE